MEERVVEKITLNTALKKKKTLSSRINLAISEFEPVGILGKGKLVKGTLLTEADYRVDIASKTMELRDLIAQKDYLDSAIMKANMETTTVINGTTYSIADLIALRLNLDNKKALLTKLRSVHTKTSRAYESDVADIERRADEMLKSDFGYSNSDVKSKSISKDAQEEHKSFIDRNMPKLIDTLKISELITNLEKFINEFDEIVDSRLSDLNGTTTIPFETSLFRDYEVLRDVFTQR